MNDSKIMVSSELEGLLPELEEQLGVNSTFITVSLFFVENNVILNSNLRSFSTTPSTYIEINISIKEALKMLKNKGDVIFEKFQINYQETNLVINGPFTIGNTSLKEINYLADNCTLGLEMIPHNDKKVIF